MAVEVAFHSSINDAPRGAKPPMPMRRHSMGQTSHKHLHQEAPAVYEQLRALFDARPESPPLATETNLASSLNNLVSQTLAGLFGEDDDRKRRAGPLSPAAHHRMPKVERSSSHELFKPNALEGLHEQLFRPQPKTASARPSPLGAPMGWLEDLAKREVAPSAEAAPSSSASPPRVSTAARAASFDKPPDGWTPTLNTVVAALKLRKLHERRFSSASDLSNASTSVTSSARDDAARVTSEDLSCLTMPEFDLQAFVEECWIAQAATDLGRKEAILEGAYDLPTSPHISPYLEGAYDERLMMAPTMSPNMAPTMSPTMPSGYAGTGRSAMGGMPMGVYDTANAPTHNEPTMVSMLPQVYHHQQLQQQQQQHAYPQQYEGQYEGQHGYEAYGYSMGAGQPWPHTHMPAVPMRAPMRAPAMAPASMWPQQATAWPQQATAWPQQATAWLQQPAMAMAPPPMMMPPARVSLPAMAIEQEGSRLLQQQLFAMGAAELANAVEELAPHLASLSTNAFGNYLVSAMAALPAAHAAVHAALVGQVSYLMQHPQGSRVTQAAFERLPAAHATSLASEMAGQVSAIACGTHGSWSVVAAYKCTRAPFILAEIAADITRLSALQNGSRVVQRVLLDAATAGEDITAATGALLGLSQPALASLSEDRFGNYVVQIALRHAPPAQRAALLDRLLSAFDALAVGKCGSNVAEVLVELSSDAQLEGVRAAIGVQHAETLRSHQFGSYVMSALDGRRAA